MADETRNYHWSKQGDDIVTLLRTVIAVPHGVDIWTTTALEAAAEIERLRAAGDQLAYHVRAENSKEMYTAVRLWEEARRG